MTGSRRLSTFCRYESAVALGVAALAALAACSGAESGPVPRLCRDSQALISPPAHYRGTSLAPKQLALTFDDGPGTNTLVLSAWLKARGVTATFFVNGKNLTRSPDAVLGALVADGHLVANHGHNHLDLTSESTFPRDPAGDAKLVQELADTDAIIAPYVEGGRFLFRAPFGFFNTRAYDALKGSAMNKYVGTIHWDVGEARKGGFGADWACWELAPMLTSRACGDLHLAEVRAVGRGIVLMHDADKGPGTNNHDVDVGVGNTFDMVKYMVPLLESEGYSFVRLDDVPDIAAALPARPAKDAGADGDAATDAGSDAAREGGSTDAASDASASPTAPSHAAPPSAPAPPARESPIPAAPSPCPGDVGRGP